MKKIFNKSINYCPLCLSKNIRKQYTIVKFKPELPIDICCDCNFMFMNPRLSNKYLSNLYSEDYYSGSANFSYHDERAIEKFSNYVWNARLKNIHKFIKNGNLLDIGAAFGGFLKAAKKYYNPYGIELSKYAGRHAKNIFSKNIHIGTLENHPFKNEQFSVITMIELLEHLPDPLSALKKCYKLLKPGGLLVIQTANMDGLQARKEKDKYHYFLPGHVSYFTEKNLVSSLIKVGFKETKTYIPVDFGVVPKLLKSRSQFKSYKDYLKWFNIIFYHYKSKLSFKDLPLTSSMVIYAFKT